MTNERKAKALVSILACAPMSDKTLETFRSYARKGDVDAIWSYYTSAIQSRPDVRRGVEGSGEVSFEMLRPAMETIYRLPTKSEDDIPF